MPNSPLRIVEFADYECPYCAKAAPAMERLVARFPGQVAVVMRHFPIRSIHRYALDAAQAAECASDQSGFQAMHGTLYREQELLRTGSWGVIAARAGVKDTAALAACVRSQRHLERILADLRAGEAVSVRATPSFVVGDVRYDGLPSDAVLDSIVHAFRRARGN